MRTGFFVAVDGPDGVGKTTACKEITRRLAQDGKTVHSIYLPGTTELGKKIREITKADSAADLNTDAVLHLILADRCQANSEVILPALRSGQVVVCDRHDASTLVYQGGEWRHGVYRLQVLKMLLDVRPVVFPDICYILTRPEGPWEKKSGDHWELWDYDEVHRRYMERSVMLPYPVEFVASDGTAVDRIMEDIHARRAAGERP